METSFCTCRCFFFFFFLGKARQVLSLSVCCHSCVDVNHAFRLLRAKNTWQRYFAQIRPNDQAKAGGTITHLHIRDRQHGRRSTALTEVSKRDPINPFEFLDANSLTIIILDEDSCATCVPVAITHLHFKEFIRFPVIIILDWYIYLCQRFSFGYNN